MGLQQEQELDELVVYVLVVVLPEELVVFEVLEEVVHELVLELSSQSEHEYEDDDVDEPQQEEDSVSARTEVFSDTG